MSTAARLIVVDALPAERALEQAATELGVRLTHCRPSREQLHDAIREYRSLFRPDQVETIAAQRAATVALMRLLSGYTPRAGGSVIDGRDASSDALVFLDTDTIEPVIYELYDRRLVWRAAEYSARHTSGRRVAHPALEVESNGHRVMLVAMPGNLAADPPCDPIDGRPMSLLSTHALAAITGEDGPAQR